MSKNQSGLDPNYWVNIRSPRLDKSLSALDIHQSDRRPPRKSPDGIYRAERRGPAARARRAIRQAYRKQCEQGSPIVGIGFREFARRAAVKAA